MTDRQGSPEEPAGVRGSELSLPDPASVGRADGISAGYTAHYQPEEQNDLAMLALSAWRIFVKRKKLIAGVILSVFAIGMLRTFMVTPLYTSTIRLQIDRNVSKVVESGSVAPIESADLDFMRTQHELLQSRSLAARVVSATRLAANEDPFTSRSGSIIGSLASLFRGETKTPTLAEREAQAVRIVLLNRSVRMVPGSRLVDISYSDPDPRRASAIAAAFGQSFIASNLEKRFQANTYAKTFLDDQVNQLRLKLEEAEKALLDFSEREQIIIVNEKASIAESNLAAANAALGQIINERIKNEQQWRQVANTKDTNLSQFLSNTVIDGLRARRNILVTEYQEKLETFKPGFPAMVQITNKIREIDRQLETEIKAIRSSLHGAYVAALNQESEMKARIDELRTEVLDLQKRSIQYNFLKREADTTRSLYNSLLQRLKEVDIAGGVGANNVFIVDNAEVPRLPSSPNIMQAVFVSLGLGLVFGIGIAFVLEKLDDTLRTIEDAERLTQLPTLGVIPALGANTSFEAELANPRSVLNESYRSLCTGLQFATQTGLPKSLYVTSTGPAEGKSTTALAIARHFSQVGLKVLLIDADLRNPSLHKKLGIPNEVGLSNLLTGSSDPPDALQRIDAGNLVVITSGPLPPNAADLLTGPRLINLLQLGLKVFDFVVVDGPPVLGLADSPILSSAAASTIFVVAASQARSGAVRAALKRLRTTRCQLVGTVLTKYDERLAGYGYGYGYGYGGYGYGPPTGETAAQPKLPSATVGTAAT
jgi:succinoglycan biosynthesis transport protein ExoP